MFNKLITLLFATAMAIMPLQSFAVQKKSAASTSTQKVVKKVEKGENTKKNKAPTKKITEKVEKKVDTKKEIKKTVEKKTADNKKAINDKKKANDKKSENNKKAVNDKKAAKDKQAVSNKKETASKKTTKAKKTVAKGNETKKLYGVKGAKLAPTKVANKVYRYREKGKTYTSIGKEPSRLFTQTGVASYYGGMFHGRKTASGEIFNKNAYTAAHKTLALGSYALVTNLRNGRKVIVRINDRGPFSHSRILDLSVAAAREIGMIYSGTARVKVEAMQVDNQGYISGKGAEALYKLAKREGLNLKVKGNGKNLAIKAE